MAIARFYHSLFMLFQRLGIIDMRSSGPALALITSVILSQLS